MQGPQANQSSKNREPDGDFLLSALVHFISLPTSLIDIQRTGIELGSFPSRMRFQTLNPLASPFNYSARFLHHSHRGVRGSLLILTSHRHLPPAALPYINQAHPFSLSTKSLSKFSFDPNPETSFLERLGFRRKQYQRQHRQDEVATMSHLYTDETPDEVKNAKGLHLITMNTPNGQAVQIFLEELKDVYGLEWTTTVINIMTNEQKKDWFLRLDPNGMDQNLPFLLWLSCIERSYQYIRPYSRTRRQHCRPAFRLDGNFCRNVLLAQVCGQE